MLQSQKQAIRLRRALLANLGILSNVVLCVLAARLGYFATSAEHIFTIAGFIWLGHIAMLLIIYTGFNVRFKDASLTFAQMTWVVLGLSVLMYFLDDLKPLILMGYLLVLSFGSFRLTSKGLYLFTTVLMVSYVISMVSIYTYRPASLDVSKELFIFIGFFLVLMGFVFMGGEFTQLRVALGERHKDLKGALCRIEALAITDELTGLYNRRHIMEVLNQQRALANRSHYGFVVAFIDLDHFKLVNDRYGHPFGDRVLASFARLIQNTVREVDVAARIGGEEFMIVLADTQLERAHDVIQRLGLKLQEVRFQEAPELSLTLSAGVTEFSPPETVEELIGRVDKLLYEAKNGGRNCIKIDTPDKQATLNLDFDNELKTPL
ncbi:diguanylate cyclase [Bermanella sp. R86510]|uniref:GGDEF domain-containing protein n=1 Tax=unclassified Bermanella TaxID=2627862 RepID=UPI0037CA55B1